MRKYSLLIAMLLTLALSLPAAVQAQVVGRVTQVEGRVDLLKGGKLPATPAKVDESVQTGDVLRTKSLSRAQLTFMDNTVITVAPESRLAIEEYLFDPAKSKRSAVLQLFQGLAHVVITKLFQVEQPDFIIKTHTAVLGVRGTELG
ncbi:MAG: FecR family protein, partial [Pseudomonadota bacterium]